MIDLQPFDWKDPQYAPIFAARAQRLRTIRSWNDPSNLGNLKLYYRDHPADFINDWGMTFDPRNVDRNLPAAIPFILFDKQRDWVDWLVQRWKAREPGITDKSRDLGLSWLAVATACTLSIFHDGFTAGFGSRKEEYVDKIGSPKSLFWKARQFLAYLPPEFRAGHIPAVHAPHLRISFPETGSVISGEAGDNIGRGDRASIYFVDEAAYLERPQLIEASLSATTNCRIDISSANGMGNPFAQKRHSKAFANNGRVFTLHWRDDPRKDDAWYAAQCENLDPVTVAQEIDINYAASTTGVVIPSVWVQASIDAHIRLGIEPSGARRGALDVADEGIDLNAFGVSYGILLEHIEEWSGIGGDIFKTVQRAFGLCDGNELSDFLYDADGLGAGVRGDARVLNELRQKEAQISGRPLRMISANPFRGSGAVLNPDGQDVPGRANADYFKNLKAQSWNALRRRFRETYRATTESGYKYDPTMLISIPSGLPLREKLVAELSQPTWGPDNVGKMVVDKAPDGMRSPNLADVVMILFGRSKRRMVINPEVLRAA